jgi:DNA-binding response OmpR family regulator
LSLGTEVALSAGLPRRSTVRELQPRKRKKILLVDDSSTLLLAARLTLGSYEVVTANNGEAGIELALSESPDLVLLDVVMPKLDGLEVCRRLRARTDTRELPILMMTTRSEPQSIEAAFASGCSEYVTKPFDGAELLAKVRSLLGE